MEGWAWGKEKRQKWQGPNGSKRLRRGEKKNTQKNCIKGFNDPYNHDGVITHLEPDIL